MATLLVLAKELSHFPLGQTKISNSSGNFFTLSPNSRYDSFCNESRLAFFCLVHFCFFLLFRAKWYTVSVTEEEVHRGLLYIDNRDQKAFFYRRKIIGLEENFQDKSAGKFIDKRVRDSFLILFLAVEDLDSKFNGKQRGLAFLFESAWYSRNRFTDMH